VSAGVAGGIFGDEAGSLSGAGFAALTVGRLGDVRRSAAIGMLASEDGGAPWPASRRNGLVGHRCWRSIGHSGRCRRWFLRRLYLPARFNAGDGGLHAADRAGRSACGRRALRYAGAYDGGLRHRRASRKQPVGVGIPARHRLPRAGSFAACALVIAGLPPLGGLRGQVQSILHGLLAAGPGQGGKPWGTTWLLIALDRGGRPGGDHRAAALSGFAPSGLRAS
jgi:multicomponent K+:H+ antiporter subunit D